MIWNVVDGIELIISVKQYSNRLNVDGMAQNRNPLDFFPVIKDKPSVMGKNM